MLEENGLDEQPDLTTDIIDVDDLASVVGLPPVWKPVIDAVVRITTAADNGSGFFISPTRVITNHHVLASPEVLKRSGVRCGFYGDNLGVRVTVEPDGYFRTSEALDYTVFSVQPVEGVAPLLLADAGTPLIGEEVCVIGHRHGAPLEYSSADGAVQSVEPPHVEYRADTEGGMSGGPVLRVATRGLLALHHFGDDDRDESNRGILATVIAEDLDR